MLRGLLVKGTGSRIFVPESNHFPRGLFSSPRMPNPLPPARSKARGAERRQIVNPSQYLFTNRKGCWKMETPM